MAQPVVIPDFSLRIAENVFISAVNSLVYNKAFFSKRDLFRKIDASLPDSILNDPNKNYILDKALENIQLVPLFPNQPINDWTQYTTSRMIRLEREMVEMANTLSDKHSIPGDPDAISKLVETAFASRPTMAEEQKAVVAASCNTDRNVVITEGAAGAGKSFSLNAIREVYESIPPRSTHPGETQGYTIIGTALSWTATKVLEESAGLSGGMAISGFVNKMQAAHDKGQDFFTKRTLIIVDEAGLAPTELVHQIFFYAKNSKQDVRIILTGDSLQLNPVQAGNALELLVSECGSTRLDTIRRQKQESHRQAVKHFCFGRAEKGLYTYHQQEAIHFLKNKEDVFNKVVEDYVAYTSTFPDKPALILALKNKDVALLNNQIRDALQANGRVEKDGVTIKTHNPIKASTKDDSIDEPVLMRQFCVGDQIVFRQNAAKHPVFETSYSKVHEALVDIKNIQEEKSTFLGFFKHLIKSEMSTKVIRNGIFNRTIGTILSLKALPDGHCEFRILLTEGGEVKISSKEYFNSETGAMPIMHNFATTIYASQGQTVPRVFLLDDPNINCKLAYVGASRHTDLFDIYLNKEELGERIRKKVSRERDKAGKKISQEMTKKNASIMSDAENNRLFDQYPNYATDHEFTEREYLGVAASTWNTPSLNQTVTMARKTPHKRTMRDLHWKSPLAPWFLSTEKATEDNPDDYAETRHVKPAFVAPQKPVEQEKPKGGIFSLFSKKVTPAANVSAAPPTPSKNDDINHILGKDWKSFDLEGVSDADLSSTKSTRWNINRYGEARAIAIDPFSRNPRARYALDGTCVVGDGEVPVFNNPHATAQTPFLIVHSFREAMISHAHYREKLGESSAKVPHIVWAAKDAKMDSLLQWLPPEPIVYIAHGKRPGSLEQAQNTGKIIESLNIPHDFRPKINTATSNQKPHP